MAEFVVKSRKNETDTPDFELEKLEKPTKPKSLESFESKAEGIRLTKKPDTLPRLPWQLERLVSSAGSGQLSVELRGVSDTRAYVLACGCAYLVGDRDEALRRLWVVHRVWQEGMN